MKNLIVAASLALTAMSPQARETYQAVWPFGMSDTSLLPQRAILDEVGRIQDRYNFVVVNRPGAGTAIASKYAETTPNSVLITSSAFFVRPNFFPKDSHDVANFRPLTYHCAVPMIIVSGKYKTINDIPRDANLTIGVSGLGVVSHLVAVELQKRFPNMQVVPYRGTAEPLIDLTEGRTDLGVTFPNTAEQWINSGKLNPIAITGPRSVLRAPTMASLGFTGTESIVNGLMMVVPRTMPEAQYKDLRDNVRKAQAAAPFQQACAREFGIAQDMSDEQLRTWWNGQQDLWKRLTQNVKLDPTK